MREPASMLSRRTFFGNAGTVGVVAAAASLVPGVRESIPLPQAKVPPENGGGYQLTEHVKRYYQSTLV